MKLLLFQKPARVVLFTSAWLIFTLAFDIQVVERRVNRSLDDYSNCCWLVLVSMTQVGYGDFVPQTSFGRVFCLVATLWGLISAALVVLSFLRSTDLTKSERRVIKIIEQTRNRKLLKQRAAYYIQAAWSLYLERLELSKSGSMERANEAMHSDPKFCIEMRRFRESRKRLHVSEGDVALIFKEVLDSRTRLEQRMDNIELKLEEMDAKFEHNIAAMNELLESSLIGRC